jgi:hypothetical protein
MALPDQESVREGTLQPQFFINLGWPAVLQVEEEELEVAASSVLEEQESVREALLLPIPVDLSASQLLEASTFQDLEMLAEEQEFPTSMFQPLQLPPQQLQPKGPQSNPQLDPQFNKDPSKDPQSKDPQSKDPQSKDPQSKGPPQGLCPVKQATNPTSATSGTPASQITRTSGAA